MRELIETKLNEIGDIDSGPFVPDGIIELGTTYFGYSIQEDYISQNMDKVQVKRLSIIGYVIRKISLTENTLSIVDNDTLKIVNKLLELNFKLSSKDINQDNNFCKKQITGYVYKDETNKKLVF